MVDFVPPHPEKGTGFHRILFIVFEHQEKIDLSDVVQGKERYDYKVKSEIMYKNRILVIGSSTRPS